MNTACALFGMWCAIATPISPVQISPSQPTATTPDNWEMRKDDGNIICCNGRFSQCWMEKGNVCHDKFSERIHPDKKWFLCTHAQEGEITVQVPSKEACIDIISIDGRGPLKTTIVNGNEKIDADNSRGWWCEEFVPQN